jgi:lysozyme family protein
MAAGNFENCLPIILRFEGGKSNDPADPGGRTNKGITQRTYDAYRERKGLQHNDVYNILDEEVEDAYKHEYWDAVEGDSLPPGLDLVVFDFAVNSGPAHALHVLHGIPGGWKDSATIEAVCSNRLAFMQSLSTWPHFGAGWARRVAQVQQQGLAMAAGKAPAAKPKVKPGHAGGAVIVAGGAAAAGAHWFGSPALAVAVGAVALVIAFYLWAALTDRQRMTARRAVKPVILTKKPEVPMPTAPTDALEAAMARVSDALHERDALVKQGRCPAGFRDRCGGAPCGYGRGSAVSSMATDPAPQAGTQSDSEQADHLD